MVAGRDRDETEMIRKAVDAALDQLERRQEVEEMTDMKQIKEEIFLEIAKRLEQAKIDTAEVRQLLIWQSMAIWVVDFSKEDTKFLQKEIIEFWVLD